MLVISRVPDLNSGISLVLPIRPAVEPPQAAAIETALHNIRCTQALGALLGAPKVDERLRCPIDDNVLVRLMARLKPIEQLLNEGFRDINEVSRRVRQLRWARAGPSASAA